MTNVQVMASNFKEYRRAMIGDAGIMKQFMTAMANTDFALSRAEISSELMSAPVFYFDDRLGMNDRLRGGGEEYHHPFESYWLVSILPGPHDNHISAIYVRTNGEAFMSCWSCNGPFAKTDANSAALVGHYLAMLHSNHIDTVEHAEVIMERGRARVEGREPPHCDPLIVIRPYARQGRVPVALQGLGLGSPRSPHDRRGHVRRLRSGRIINVRACAIHGGASETRNYRVTA